MAELARDGLHSFLREADQHQRPGTMQDKWRVRGQLMHCRLLTVAVAYDIP